MCVGHYKSTRGGGCLRYALMRLQQFHHPLKAHMPTWVHTVANDLCKSFQWHVCMHVCQPVMESLSDKTDVSELQGSWMFHRVSQNTTSHHCVVSWQEGGGLHILQGPSAGPGKTPSGPPHLLQYGKPMVCGFCSGYIQATWSCSVSGSSEDMDLNYQDEWTGRVIMGNGQLLFWHASALWLALFWAQLCENRGGITYICCLFI